VPTPPTGVALDRVDQVRHRVPLGHTWVLEQHRRLRHVAEEPDAVAEQHGHQLDPHLVEQPRVQRLPRDRPGVDADDLVARGRLRLSDRALDAVGDERERCIIRRWSLRERPLGRRPMREDEHRNAERVEAAPSLRLVELPPPDDQRSRAVPDLAEVLRARLRRREHPSAADGRELDVAVEVPVEERTDVAGRVRDEPVQRNRRSGADRPQRSSSSLPGPTTPAGIGRRTRPACPCSVRGPPRRRTRGSRARGRPPRGTAP